MPGTPLQSSLDVIRLVSFQFWENGSDWTLESARTGAALAGSRPASNRTVPAAESKRRLRRGASGDTAKPSQVAREMPRAGVHRTRRCHTKTDQTSPDRTVMG